MKNHIEEYLSQMINLNLIFLKKVDEGLDLFYKTTEKDDEIHLKFPILQNQIIQT